MAKVMADVGEGIDEPCWLLMYGMRKRLDSETGRGV